MSDLKKLIELAQGIYYNTSGGYNILIIKQRGG